MASTGETIFQTAYEIAPIILQGGIANALGGYVPLNLILPSLGGVNFVANYKPLPGGTLADWQVAEYPFANFVTAANSVVQNPLKISMLMVAPAQNEGGYILKQAIFTALQYTIQQHISLGGTFTVITPAFTYANCLLTSIRDITNPSEKQVQKLFQWDFTQPLITSSAAQSVLGSLMNKVNQGLPTLPSWNAPVTDLSTPLVP
jgi:hypothetical protein